MRSFVLVAVPLLMASAIVAHSPLKRGIHTDICAHLDVDLVFSDVEANGKPYNAGHIDIGLCVSQVKSFVGHYDVTEAAAKVVGVDKVESKVIELIKKTGVQCSYPPHARPSVTTSNECDFICTDGFLAIPANHPSSCVCPPSHLECNGKCSQISDCSTKPPPSRRQNEPKCAKDLTMCGVPDARWGQAFKCANVTSDSYTCGGCVKASPFGSSSTGGVNCHDIPNVDEVSCIDSKCFVHTCKSGFTESASNDGCVATHGKDARTLPLPTTGYVVNSLDTATGSVTGSHVIGRSSVVDEVPGTDAPLDATRETLSAGKADTKVRS
ncbi:hypothetical protein JVT61DRAFT_1831 [Boletus reticuloceps]|uniref:Protein CPL1-like domain-containing protein n=1 Tax=Boletus reticuloceps TaxID=495285 RepID=A0A8I3ABZ3_9AGAM|nr:hypothetical protein JVT61DRAFT_1831 [Boletus reticuloceps]